MQASQDVPKRQFLDAGGVLPGLVTCEQGRSG